jgi:hypothetical protein
MSDTPARADQLPLPDASDMSYRNADGRFDYESLSSENAQALRERGDRIRTAVQTTAVAIIAIGAELIAAKKTLGHGRFVHWVETECGFSLRSAQNYMKICRLAGKCATVAHLPPNVVYKITRRRVRRELLGKLSTRGSGDGEISEAELDSLCKECNEIHNARRNPARAPSHLRRRPAAAPRERPSPALNGLTKTEYAQLSARYIMENFGRSGAGMICLMAENDTFHETARILRLERRRLEFDQRFEDL